MTLRHLSAKPGEDLQAPLRLCHRAETDEHAPREGARRLQLRVCSGFRAADISFTI